MLLDEVGDGFENLQVRITFPIRCSARPKSVAWSSSFLSPELEEIEAKIPSALYPLAGDAFARRCIGSSRSSEYWNRLQFVRDWWPQRQGLNL